MIPFFVIMLLLSAIAVPMFLEEQRKQKEIELRNKEQMTAYGSNPFAPNGAFEPDLMDAPMNGWAQPEPSEHTGFSNSDGFSLNPVQPLNPLFEPPATYLPEPFHELPENSFLSESGRQFLGNNGPFHEFSIPDVEITDGQLKTLAKTAIFLSMAYQAGVSKTQAYQQILGIHKGGNKAYRRFEMIWDEIRNFG